MEKIILNSSIKEIAIYNNNDELVTILRIDTADSEVAIKFSNIIKTLNDISKNFTAEVRKITSPEHYGSDDVIQFATLRVKYIKNIMTELDKIFGENTCQNIWHETIPDELAISDFVEKVVPVMNSLYNTRYEMNRKRFNSQRKGER